MTIENRLCNFYFLPRKCERRPESGGGEAAAASDGDDGADGVEGAERGRLLEVGGVARRALPGEDALEEGGLRRRGGSCDVAASAALRE